MPVIDYIFLGLVALSVLLGFMRGFFREALSLASWVLALWLFVRERLDAAGLLGRRVAVLLVRAAVEQVQDRVLLFTRFIAPGKRD